MRRFYICTETRWKKVCRRLVYCDVSGFNDQRWFWSREEEEDFLPMSMCRELVRWQATQDHLKITVILLLSPSLGTNLILLLEPAKTMLQVVCTYVEQCGKKKKNSNGSGRGHARTTHYVSHFPSYTRISRGYSQSRNKRRLLILLCFGPGVETVQRIRFGSSCA